MLENWMWDANIIQRVSKHYMEKIPLPEEMINAKLKVKTLNEATFTLRQIFFGTFDFLLHSADDKKMLDLKDDIPDRFYSISNIRKTLKRTETGSIDT